MAVIIDHGGAWRGAQGRGEEDGAVAAHVGGALGARGAGRRGGVREVEGRAGEACKQARAAGSHARGGVTGRVYAKAAENANAVLAFAAAAVLLMALLTGQMCHKAYLDGQAHGIAASKAEAEAQAYDRGYAAAVYEYQEGEAAWAR